MTQDGDCQRCKGKGCVACDAREQEPVACIIDGDLYHHHEIDWEDLAYQGHGVELLYTHPHPQPKTDHIEQHLEMVEQEPVIDKSAAIRIATALGWGPKREWVGLTEEERLTAIWIDGTFGAGVEWAEAKLKEKNT